MRRPDTIDALLAALRAQTAEIRDLAASLDRGAFGARPGEAKWSAGEHLEHLALTNTIYARAIDEAIGAARERGLVGDGPYRGTIMGRMFLHALDPPPKMNVKTFKYLEPAKDLDPQQTIDRFVEAQHSIERSLEAARGVDLTRARMRSPFMAFLRMAVVESFQVVLAHNARHLWHVRDGLARMGHGPAPAKR